ncbi:hypothetical protein WN48_07677 [Eufriesea mexicana]|uniref:Ig-like domain-containing protein n=1 Tax=Eufriesea mexicana TaxID=516756 RepID=A0A310SSQ8_9HYME|nr:hypothetical protein WN48_07677 [Eufriesea mexicana]
MGDDSVEGSRVCSVDEVVGVQELPIDSLGAKPFPGLENLPRSFWHELSSPFTEVYEVESFATETGGTPEPRPFFEDLESNITVQLGAKVDMHCRVQNMQDTLKHDGIVPLHLGAVAVRVDAARVYSAHIQNDLALRKPITKVYEVESFATETGGTPEPRPFFEDLESNITVQLGAKVDMHCRVQNMQDTLKVTWFEFYSVSKTENVEPSMTVLRATFDAAASSPEKLGVRALSM